VIDFGVLKVTFNKIAIGKHSGLKKTSSKVTTDERTILKLGVANFFRCKRLLTIFFVVGKIQTHVFFQK
jgi:hypothetical protein